MSSKAQTKNCQNCKNNFTIESEDFDFYEKIKVPPPTFCPWCRFIRRANWRNERSLHKRVCDMCNKNMVSIYRGDTPFPVYCISCWYSDKWNASSYAMDYDFSKTFFAQFKALQNRVPRMNLWQRDTINSEYSNMTAESKNIYLSVSVVAGSEDVFYSRGVDASRKIFDSYGVKNSENCYENIEGQKNYNSQYLTLSRNCIDSYFLFDCANCSNCFMSSNLRNKQFYFKNKEFTKEEYFKLVEGVNLGSRKYVELLKEEFDDLCQNSIYRFSNIIASQDSSGNNLLNTKNCKECFDCYNGENFKYCHRAFVSKDSMDMDYSQTSELMYEYTTGGLSDYNVKFSYSALGNIRDSDYTDCCLNSVNLFGCIGMRNAENVILNKKYSEEEFKSLKSQIIEHMKVMPYVDDFGRVYSYGEFFPFEISPLAYNETYAQEMEPLTETEINNRGYVYKSLNSKNFDVTISPDAIPDDINLQDENILDEVLGCSHALNCNHQCSGAFRVTLGEFQFYKSHNIPLPNKCPNCRHYERLEKVPAYKLYIRNCACGADNHGHAGVCQNTFQSPYSDTVEKVYCEDCYNKEIY